MLLAILCVCMYFKLSIVMSSFSKSAISFSCPNRFRAPRVTSVAWCRKGHVQEYKVL